MPEEKHNKIPLILSGIAVVFALAVLMYSTYQIVVEPTIEEEPPIRQDFGGVNQKVKKKPTPTMTLKQEILRAIDGMDKAASEEAVPEI